MTPARATALLLTILSITTARADNLDNALRQLDQTLEHRQTYVERRQNHIDSLTRRHRSHPSDIATLADLADQYISFNTDSALHYLAEGSRLPGSEALPFRWKHAMLLPLAGYPEGAESEYNSITPDSVPPELMADYLEAGRQLQSYIAAYYQRLPELAAPHVDSTTACQQRLLQVLPQDSPDYKYNLAEYYLRTGRRERAQVLLEEIVDNPALGLTMHARAAHHLAEIALGNGDQQSYLAYLALSADADVRNATREMVSLQELGTHLTSPTQVDRAYRYLSIALENAVACGATMRTLYTSEAIPIIEKAHSARISAWRRGIYWIIAVLTLVLATLIVTLLFLRHEMAKMGRLQKNLAQANKTRESYISQFLSLCSIYMDKLNQFSDIVNRKLAAGQADELARMTKSGRFVEQQTKEFYSVFDNAFLHIYPDFVAEVNALLRDDAHISLKEGELLNTDLRILALYRMGIDDSTRIAKVLNYSLNTIYAYRNRLKARAKDRENFERLIAKGGDTHL